MLKLFGVWVEKLARYMAILGGMALVTIALITVVSVLGRALLDFGFRPLRGQFELVEAGTLFAVCAFLPWCHLKKGHASVGILTDFMGPRVNAALDFAGDFLLTALALIMAWQLYLGMLDKFEFGETSFMLRYPVWWAYGAALIGLVTWVIVGLWASINSASGLFNISETAVNDRDDGSGGGI